MKSVVKMMKIGKHRPPPEDDDMQPLTGSHKSIDKLGGGELCKHMLACTYTDRNWDTHINTHRHTHTHTHTHARTHK